MIYKLFNPLRNSFTILLLWVAIFVISTPRSNFSSFLTAVRLLFSTASLYRILYFSNCWHVVAARARFRPITPAVRPNIPICLHSQHQPMPSSLLLKPWQGTSTVICVGPITVGLPTPKKTRALQHGPQETPMSFIRSA